MAGPLLQCEAHGTPTRLTCAECATPICPKCLVKTPVGLKCEDHAQAVAPRLDRRATPLAVGALVLVLAAAVIMAVAVLRRGSGNSTATPATVPEPGGDAGTGGRVEPAQVFVVNADGSSAHTLTNRPLAFDASPAWSPDGQRIAFESTQDGKRAIWTMQADGLRLRRLTDGNGAEASPAWSPDGSHIAFMSDRDGSQEIYVMGAEGNDARRLTDNPAADGFPAWSPDGSRIAFVSDRDGQPGLWVMGADGAAPARLVPGSAAPARPTWSPDGRTLAFASDRDGGNLDVYVAAPGEVGGASSTASRLVGGPGQDGEPAWSPDGTRLAFASDRDGTAEVYLVNRDGSGLVRLTTRPRSFTPAWAPNGAQILFILDPLPNR